MSSGEVCGRAVPEIADCRADASQREPNRHVAGCCIGAHVEFKTVEDVAEAAVLDSQAAAIGAAFMPVGLDVDGSVARKTHGKARGVGPCGVGQGDGDGVFGQACVIGNGQRAVCSDLGQGANGRVRELPRGGGGGEEGEGKGETHAGEIGARDRLAREARDVEVPDQVRDGRDFAAMRRPQLHITRPARGRVGVLSGAKGLVVFTLWLTIM